MKPKADSPYSLVGQETKPGLKLNAGTASTWGPQYASGDGSDLPVNYSLAGGGPMRLSTGSVAPAAEPFIDSDNYDLMGTPRQVGVAGKDGARGAWGVAQSLAGDGASNADVNRIKNQLLALNPEMADGVQKGQRYYVPDASTPENLALARSADRQSQVTAAAAPQSETQEPVWNMRDASAPLRVQGGAPALDGPAVGSPEWFRTASDAALHANGYQTVSAYDPAAARAADVRRESLLNFLNGQGSMAIGGVISAGVMLGTNDIVAASQATDALEPIDGLLAPMGGGSATRLGRARGSRPIDYAKTYEADVRGLYGEVPFQQRTYESFVNGKWVNGVADNVTVLNGRNAAIEAKYVDDWAASLRNPASPEGNRPWAVAEQQKMIDQAVKYSRAFEQTIYHTNSVDLANHYTPLFQQAGATNFRFVITPPITPKP